MWDQRDVKRVQQGFMVSVKVPVSIVQEIVYQDDTELQVRQQTCVLVHVQLGDTVNRANKQLNSAQDLAK
jgi:hypothetical protein